MERELLWEGEPIGDRDGDEDEDLEEEMIDHGLRVREWGRERGFNVDESVYQWYHGGRG